MKKNNIIVTMIFSILFLSSIYFYFINSNKIKDTITENNSLKIEFQSLKSENQSLREINNQLLETKSNVAEKVTQLKITNN